METHRIKTDASCFTSKVVEFDDDDDLGELLHDPNDSDASEEVSSMAIAHVAVRSCVCV
jgi:hypothetical protein